MLPRRPIFSFLFVSATHCLDLSYSLHLRVPITCIIVINSLYPLTLASGTGHFRILLPVTVFVHIALVDMIRLRQIIHKVVFLAYRFQGAEWC